MIGDPVWLPSPVFPERYEVSDHGQVRAQERWIPHRTPSGLDVLRHVRPEPLATGLGGRNKRYLRVMLHGPVKPHKVHAYVHVIVCTAFHGPRPDGTVCCHRNDDQQDNMADNLYWGTPLENQNDAMVNRCVAFGASDDEEMPW